jgi:WD40 repeat protein
VARAAFTPGYERAEIEALWAQVNEDAGKRLGLFNAHWFARLLDTQGTMNGEHSTIVSEPAQDASNMVASSLHRPTAVVDWGEAIDVPILYGRETELATLEPWVLTDRCRVVALLGLGGIGKTSLALTLARQVAPHFDIVLFRSVRNAPPLGPLLDGLIRTVSMQQETPSDRIADKIAQLIELLRARRCLLILDNLETIMQAGEHAGDYRADFADYGELIQRLAETPHQSCLLLTSREKSRELGPLEGRTAPVRTLLLGGLPGHAGRTILEEKDVYGSDAEAAALVQLYGGNPLALKLVSEPIREVFGGDVRAFLAAGDAFFNGVGKLLEQHFARSAPLEQALLFWLAIERDLASLNALLADLAGTASQREVLMALESLRRRLLIERGAGQPTFTLQPVVMEYLTDRLLAQATQELIGGELKLLLSHALLQTRAKEYIRESQVRLLIEPVLGRLRQRYGTPGDTAQALSQHLPLLRALPPEQQRYGGGNIANLLAQLQGHLRGIDLSDLTLWQPFFAGLEMQGSNLRAARVDGAAFTGTIHGVTDVAVSPDGQYLGVATLEHTVRVWRSADYAPIMASVRHPGPIHVIAFRPDGAVLASGSMDGTIRLWQVPEGIGLGALDAGQGVVDVAWSLDGTLLASTYGDGAIALWNAATGQIQYMIQEHTGITISITFSPDGRLLASGGNDQTVYLWDVASGQLRATLRGHTGIVYSVAFSPDGRLLASAGGDRIIRLWDILAEQVHTVLDGHHAAVRSVAFFPNGSALVSGGDDPMVRVWDVASGQRRMTLTGYRQMTLALAWHPNGHLLASDSDRMVLLWTMPAGQMQATLSGHTRHILSVAFSHDGQTLASGSGDGTVRLWDVTSCTMQMNLQGHSGPVNSVVFSPDGRLLASAGADRRVIIWSASSGARIRTLEGHAEPVASVTWSPDSRLLASGGNERGLIVWDATSGQHVGTFGQSDVVRRVAWSPDGRWLAGGGGYGTIQLWDASALTFGRVSLPPDMSIEAGTEDAIILHGHTGDVKCLVWNRDGTLLASASLDGTARIWDVARRETIAVLTSGTGQVWAVAFSPDGSMLASGGSGGWVYLWDVATGTQLAQFRRDRPYERMRIGGVVGLTEPQVATLHALGAVD